MTGCRDEIAELLRVGGGVVAPADHPRLRRSLYRLRERGELVGLLPGVLVDRGRAADPEVRILAASRWAPGAVLTGAAAARVTFWPDLVVGEVTLSSPRRLITPPGFRIVQERLDPELVWRGRGPAVTVPALTALDLVEQCGGDGIDRALRMRACTLAQMHRALERTPRRPGNPARRLVLKDSRDEPWSAAERFCHQLLRAAGIRGWRANVAVRCGGSTYFVDVGFEGAQVGIEVDGFVVHSERRQFHHDRRRWSDLTAAGWRIVHVTWEQLTTDSDWFVRVLKETLAQFRGVR